jgi:hypothetical protein
MLAAATGVTTAITLIIRSPVKLTALIEPTPPLARSDPRFTR